MENLDKRNKIDLVKNQWFTWHSTWYHVDEFSWTSFAVRFVSRKWNFNFNWIISIAIQKKSSVGVEFRPYNKINPLGIDGRRIKSNEKRVGAKVENVAPGYTAYPWPFSSNIRPSTSQLGPSGPGYSDDTDLQSGKLLFEVIVQVSVNWIGYVELTQSGESRMFIPTNDVKFVSIT